MPTVIAEDRGRRREGERTREEKGNESEQRSPKRRLFLSDEERETTSQRFMIPLSLSLEPLGRLLVSALLTARESWTDHLSVTVGNHL